MSYKDLNIQISYKSKGNNKITDDFLLPVLRQTKIYKRSVGFFSSGVFDAITDGIVSMSRNGGVIQLIASPQMKEDDIRAIELGYAEKKDRVTETFSNMFVEELEKMNDTSLQLLAEIIAKGILDIRIAVTDDNGIYHDKLGILEDNNGNKIVFYGSSNSSRHGYINNYEKIRVTTSWTPGASLVIADEEEEFDLLWNGSNEYVNVYPFSESAEKHVIEVIESRKRAKNNKIIKLFDYQEEAIAKWKDNGYKGFYVMATGTGKTWTAIFSAKELVKEHSCMITICAPYKHLVKQWAEDVINAFPDAILILVSSENLGWDKQLTDAIIKSRYDEGKQIIVISTISSFNLPRFKETMSKYKGEQLLIVDEAHRFNCRESYIHEKYQYMLGLSATPFSGSSAEKGKELMNFFGGQVFSLPIEEALEKKYLVPYYYLPIIVYATTEEERNFNNSSRIIASCFRNGVCIDPDKLVKELRNRLRIISMAEEKQTKIDDIINSVEEKDHFVVYCGDGRLFDNDIGTEIRHISSVKKVLSEHGYKSSQFTATESMKERMELVESFNNGEISALAAIRCLDEGINIPSIKSALILSSNDDYREFVQRRGRILRKYDNKKFAKIYDILVLPSTEMEQWAKIELRRYREYAKLALNWEDTLEKELSKLLLEYGLTDEDIDVYDYDDMEEPDDE